MSREYYTPPPNYKNHTPINPRFYMYPDFGYPSCMDAASSLTYDGMPRRSIRRPRVNETSPFLWYYYSPVDFPYPYIYRV